MLPPLLGGIVRRLLGTEPGISVVGDAVDEAALADIVRRQRPHAVVVELDGDVLPPPLCLLHCEFPDLTWIAVSRDHARATVHVFRRDPLPDVGPRDLVSAIHAAGRRE